MVSLEFLQLDFNQTYQIDLWDRQKFTWILGFLNGNQCLQSLCQFCSKMRITHTFRTPWDEKYIKSLFNLYSSCSHITKENFDKSDNIFLIDSWLMRNSLTTNFTKTAWDYEKMDTGKFLGDKKKMLTRWTKSSKRQKLVNTHWIKISY